MKTTEHLKDTAWTDWLENEKDPAAREHLAACADCRQEAARLRRTLGAFRDAMHTAAETRTFAWVPPAEAGAARAWWPAVRRWAPRAALAACLLAAVLLMHSPRTAPKPSASDAADNALLQSIQSDINQQVPTALAPAESLVAQMTSNSQAQGGNQ